VPDAGRRIEFVSRHSTHRGSSPAACYPPRLRPWTRALLLGLTTCALAQAPPPEQTPPDLGQFTNLLARMLRAGPPGPTTTEPVPAETPADGPAQVTTTADGRLDLHVRGMEIGTVLELLSYQARANIVTSTSVTGSISANLYSVTLEQALDAILRPNKFAFRTLNGGVFVGTPEELAALEPLATRVFPLQHLPTQEAATAVKAVLGPSATVFEGGAKDQGAAAASTGEAEMGSAGHNYLIVTAHPDRLALAERVLKEIDCRPQQVLIEATVLRATLNEQNQFGIDFSLLGGVDFQNVNSSSDASTNLRTGALPPREFQDTTFNFNTNFAGQQLSGGLNLGLIKNNIAAFIRALEQVTDVIVVANPKVVALNRQEGEVIVGRRDGYLTTMVTQTAAVQKVEFLETGTQIKFRPVINPDGTVRLLVHPKDSNGGLTSANLPFEETTEAHSDILVQDGDTVLIGGLFRERTVNTRDQIPLLGDVPGLGLLFGSRNDQSIREEVIILLTVHVLKQDEHERREFRELADDIERIRVGNRRGLLGSGRERLAQAHYQEALSQLERGHRGLALLNLRMTLHNQPRHVAAMKLYERILGERLWDEEGTRMRTFIWDLLRTGPQPAPPPAEPVFGRPAAAALRGAWASGPVAEDDSAAGAEQP
jgi:type IV pilus assembly protein PilQ